MKRILWVILIIAAITACSKKVPLNKDQFTSLLIDMHTTDGMLSVAQGDIRTKIRDILGAFMFGGEASEKKVKVLSGGERTR